MLTWGRPVAPLVPRTLQVEVPTTRVLRLETASLALSNHRRTVAKAARAARRPVTILVVLPSVVVGLVVGVVVVLVVTVAVAVAVVGVAETAAGVVLAVSETIGGGSDNGPKNASISPCIYLCMQVYIADVTSVWSHRLTSGHNLTTVPPLSKRPIRRKQIMRGFGFSMLAARAISKRRFLSRAVVSTY